VANVRINVPQESGEIVVSVAGDDPVTYKVTDGHVSVPEESASRFLAAVDGSKRVDGGSTSTAGKEK
jgi:hypothetical protein